MQIQEALTGLGLQMADADEEHVRAAWKKLVMSAHPDHGGDVVEFSRLRECYYTALEYVKMPVKCPDCKGTGKRKVTHGFYTAQLPCERCEGTGYIERKNLRKGE